MRVFWRAVVEPLFEVVRPRVIVEVGVGTGDTTRMLLAFAAANHAVLHSIDPEPQKGFDFEKLKGEHGEHFVFHRAPSLEALNSAPELEAVDAALIDGDHNWYTVYNELQLIAARTEAAERSFPLTFLHDVDWPYGRRDQYYGPDRIPAEHRQEFRTGGIAPGRAEPDRERGVSVGYFHAIAEGGPRNGVRTAIEDFMSDSALPLRSVHVPGFHGLMILVPEQQLDENEELRSALDSLHSPAWLEAWCQRIEKGRLAERVRFAETRRALLKAQHP